MEWITSVAMLILIFLTLSPLVVTFVLSVDNLCKQFGSSSLDPDQAQCFVGPDLDPNYLTFWWYSWKIFLEKVNFKENSTDDNKACKELKYELTKTRLYNFDPLKPHFYIVKLGFTGVYIIFFYFG